MFHWLAVGEHQREEEELQCGASDERGMVKVFTSALHGVGSGPRASGGKDGHRGVDLRTVITKSREGQGDGGR